MSIQSAFPITRLDHTQVREVSRVYSEGTAAGLIGGAAAIAVWVSLIGFFLE